MCVEASLGKFVPFNIDMLVLNQAYVLRRAFWVHEGEDFKYIMQCVPVGAYVTLRFALHIDVDASALDLLEKYTDGEHERIMLLYYLNLGLEVHERCS